MLIFDAFWIFAGLCWAYALWFGGGDARVAFALFLLAMIGSAIAEVVIDPGGLATTWTGFNAPLFLADLIYFVGLYLLALKSKRYWPIWSAGFQLLCVLVHLGPLLDPVLNPKFYRALESMWIVPMLLTMVLGIARDRRALPTRKRLDPEFGLQC